MNIIVVDDHPLFRDALRSMFRVGLPSARIEEAGSIEAAKRVLADRPGMDLIVLDLTMDDVKGFEGLMALRICFPRIPILVCSALDEPRIIREAIRLGAAGFVPKSAGKSVYMEALDQILAGAIYMPDSVASCSEANIPEPIPAAALIATLTPAQMNVLTMIKRGKINKQIAYDLGIGDSMVKAHVSEIMRKLGVQNRTQVALCATALDFNRAGVQELSQTR